jgi:lipopolysaccharide export system permease protein
MILSRILFLYCLRQYALHFISAASLISICIFFVNIFDSLNKFRSEIIPLSVIFKIAIYYLPHVINEVFPIIIIISSLFLLNTFSKKNELIVIFSGGVSIWKFMQPFLIGSFFLSILALTILQPFSSACIEEKTKLERKYNSKKGPVLSISNGGIFISEFIDNENRILNAKYIINEEKLLADINLIILDNNFSFKKRIIAENALIHDNLISLSGEVYAIDQQGNQNKLDKLSLETKLDFENIVKKFESPESVSFWKLGDVAKSLEESGIKASKFINYFYKLLFRPLYTLAVVIISICFLNINPRGEKGYRILGLGSIISLIVHIFSEIIYTLLITNSFSPAAAQLISSSFLGLFGIVYLIHKYET